MATHLLSFNDVFHSGAKYDSYIIVCFNYPVLLFSMQNVSALQSLEDTPKRHRADDPVCEWGLMTDIQVRLTKNPRT